jgi:pSer/pThr/pTyr-binding forkhead associated (FHA) protein
MPECTLPGRETPLISLEVTQGPWSGTLIPVKATRFLIGRGPECQLRPTSARVEDHHCGIEMHSTSYFLRAFQSSAGTYLNDRQVFGRVELRDQDSLRVGPLQFRVNIPASGRCSDDLNPSG